MTLITNAISGLLSGAGPALILLGLLIFVHELGHFLVAKLMGVRVEVFSLGFGRKIFSFKGGDTTYCVSIIPLGGYVKMYGDDPDPAKSQAIPESERRYSFLHKPVSQRIAIVLAGPLMNLFFAAFLFVLIGLVGEPLPGSYVGDVPPGSRAFEAGFRSGDHILTVDGAKVQVWPEVKAKVADTTDRRLRFEVEREGTFERAQVEVTPVLGPNDNIVSARKEIGLIEGLDSTSAAAIIGIIDPDSAAAKSGLKSLDVISKVNDRDVYNWRDLERYLLEDLAKGQTPVHLTVESYSEGDKPKPRDVVFSSPAPSTPTELQSLTLLQFGIEPAQLYLWKVKSGSPADEAGLKVGDRILSIDGQSLENWTQVMTIVKGYNPDKEPLQFTYRRGREVLAAAIRPSMTTLMDASRGKEEQRFTVGIVSGSLQSGPRSTEYKAASLGQAFSSGMRRTVETTEMVIVSLLRLVQGDVSAKNIGGIISIGRFANQSYDAGLAAFLRMMALISINLFLINLFPVPILDGGHLVFFSIEALRGAPLSMRKMEIAQQVGLVLLMSLMIFALFNDISNWLNSAW